MHHLNEELRMVIATSPLRSSSIGFNLRKSPLIVAQHLEGSPPAEAARLTHEQRKVLDSKNARPSKPHRAAVILVWLGTA